jgi:hypothetical protein
MADTSEPTSDTEGEVEVDASVTEAETTEATSAPVVTSASPVTSDEAPTSAPEASSSADVTSDELYGPNLITNSGFEGNSSTGWAPFGAGTVSASNTYADTGTYSGRATGRTATWNGIGVNLLASASAETTYHVEASVRISAASDTVKLTFAFKCDALATEFVSVVTSTANNTGWSTLSGSDTLPACAGTVTQLDFYVEGPAAAVDIYVDDVSVREVL